MKESTIYLYTDNIGWEEFSINDTKALSERNIMIGSNVTIGNNVRIGNNVTIYIGVTIGNNVTIGRNVTIDSGVRIGSDAIIDSGIAITMSIFITGSRHSVLYYDTENLHIGCKLFNVNDPIEVYESFAKDRGYSDVEIEEYRKYVEFIKSIHSIK